MSRAISMATLGVINPNRAIGMSSLGVIFDGEPFVAKDTKTRPYRGLAIDEYLTIAQQEDEFLIMACMHLLQLRRSRRTVIHAPSTDQKDT